MLLASCGIAEVCAKVNRPPAIPESIRVERRPFQVRNRKLVGVLRIRGIDLQRAAQPFLPLRIILFLHHAIPFRASEDAVHQLAQRRKVVLGHIRRPVPHGYREHPPGGIGAHLVQGRLVSLLRAHPIQRNHDTQYSNVSAVQRQQAFRHSSSPGQSHPPPATPPSPARAHRSAPRSLDNPAQRPPAPRRAHWRPASSARPYRRRIRPSTGSPFDPAPFAALRPPQFRTPAAGSASLQRSAPCAAVAAARSRFRSIIPPLSSLESCSDPPSIVGRLSSIAHLRSTMQAQPQHSAAHRPVDCSSAVGRLRRAN